MFTQDQIENFFAETRETYRSGRSKWNIDDVCRWSYFFVDSDRDKLRPIAKHLEALGYEVIGALDPDEFDETSAYFLRLDRIERHSPQSLHELNQGLCDVTERFGVSSYDGMTWVQLMDHRSSGSAILTRIGHELTVNFCASMHGCARWRAKGLWI